MSKLPKGTVSSASLSFFNYFLLITLDDRRDLVPTANGEFSRVALDPLITIDHRLEISAVRKSRDQRKPYSFETQRQTSDCFLFFLRLLVEIQIHNELVKRKR